MDTNDVMERTLAKEKAQYEKCCKVMHIFSIMMSIMFAAATVLCLIVPTVQLIQQSNQGMETDIKSTAVSAFYLFLVLGGIGLLWNSARHIFRRLRTVKTPFCYDIADKIKGAGFLAVALAVIWRIYRTIAELLIKNGKIRIVWEPEAFKELGNTIIFSMAMLGVVLIIIAYVFNYGCKLQQEADETL